MAMVSMDFKLHLPFIILYNNNNLYKTMIILEQFNEEVMKEFDRRTNPNNYEKKDHYSYNLKQPNDSLLDSQNYPESPYEIYGDSVKEFITQKLTEHKALILKMVREKMPSEELFDHEKDQDIHFLEGWNTYRKEFLNNLDTI